MSYWFVCDVDLPNKDMVPCGCAFLEGMMLKYITKYFQQFTEFISGAIAMSFKKYKTL